jgi:hypothetical protein
MTDLISQLSSDEHQIRDDEDRRCVKAIRELAVANERIALLEARLEYCASPESFAALSNERDELAAQLREAAQEIDTLSRGSVTGTATEGERLYQARLKYRLGMY